MSKQKYKRRLNERGKIESLPQKVARLEKELRLSPKEEILERKVRLLEARLALKDAQHRAIIQSRANRVERHRTQQLFMPKLTEGAKAFKSLLSGESKDIQLSAEQLDKVAELAVMLTDDAQLVLYTTWEMRAIALGVTVQQLYTLRRSKAFHSALVEAIRGTALEGVASAVKVQGDLAASWKTGSTVAFDKLTDVAGLKQPKTVKLTQTNNNITFEQKLREAVKVVDADFVRLPPGKKAQ